jgi:hypothetical protein
LEQAVIRANPSTAANSTCARCGASFRCGVSAGDQACWCMSLPPLLPLPELADAAAAPAASCLCPDCLKARLSPRE